VNRDLQCLEQVAQRRTVIGRHLASDQRSR
jgi:hypothetical protein